MENTIIKSIKCEKTDSDSNETYHEHDSISASGLKLMKRSPAHYFHREKKETEAMRFGTMYHTFILENDKFHQQYSVIDTDKRPDQKHTMAAKENVQWLESFNNPVSAETYQQLKDMRKVLFSHPYARHLLTGGEFEASYYLELDIGANEPVKARFRPDHVKHDKRIIVDLKTAADASMDGFQRDAAKVDYQIQAAFYADMMELITGEDSGYEFFFVAQEKSPPYAFNIFEASPQFRSVGRYEYELLLMLYAYCVESGKWPGYQVFCQNRYGVNELALPPWAIKEMEYYTSEYWKNK